MDCNKTDRLKGFCSPKLTLLNIAPLDALEGENERKSAREWILNYTSRTLPASVDDV